MTSVATLGAELVAYAAAVSLSPIHIGLLLLMLLGPNPIQRGSWFVLSWMVTIGGVVVVLLTGSPSYTVRGLRQYLFRFSTKKV